MPDAGAAMRPFEGVHAAVAHDSAERHVTGGALYIDDLPEPAGLTHVHVGQSARAHARIAAMDLSAVRAAPGVVAPTCRCGRPTRR